MDRPGLLNFHAAAEDGAVDVLLIHSLTRLGRDTDKVTNCLGLEIWVAKIMNPTVRSSYFSCNFLEMIPDRSLREVFALSGCEYQSILALLDGLPTFPSFTYFQTLFTLFLPLPGKQFHYKRGGL